MPSIIPVSCVIPIYNEENTIQGLLNSLELQELQPAEVILVDGGSTDSTISVLNTLIIGKKNYKVIQVSRAMPGQGRNIGASAASNEWIVFTDAGIKLDIHWLKNLYQKVIDDPDVAIVYGNFSPIIEGIFCKAATISYVPPLKAGQIRTKTIVSCLLQKEIWKQAGGFPDWRAAEDLIFMENADKLKRKQTFAPDAMAYWYLRPDISTTYKKFDLYSMHNVWAGRQAYWHYGVRRQYLILLLFAILGLIFSPYYLLLIPSWFAARTAKRIWMHKFEFGWTSFFNPSLFFLVLLIIICIDAATFSGWIKAILKPNSSKVAIQNN